MRFNTLEGLEVVGAVVGDTGFEGICKLTSFKSLLLIDGTMTDDGLAKVRALTSLEELQLIKASRPPMPGWSTCANSTGSRSSRSKAPPRLPSRESTPCSGRGRM